MGSPITTHYNPLQPTTHLRVESASPITAITAITAFLILTSFYFYFALIFTVLCWIQYRILQAQRVLQRAHVDTHVALVV